MSMKKRANITCQINMKPWSALGNGSVTRERKHDTIQIHATTISGEQYITGLTTRQARILAKRINQFIDAGG